jgi:hypothetical protein
VCHTLYGLAIYIKKYLKAKERVMETLTTQAKTKAVKTHYVLVVALWWWWWCRLLAQGCS